MTAFDPADLPAPEVEAQVRQALEVDEAMPAAVWDRLSAALAAEPHPAEPHPAEAGAAAEPAANVVPLRARRRLLPGLVAAGVVLVAVGVVAPNLRTPTDPVAAPAPEVAAFSVAESAPASALKAALAPAADAMTAAPARQVLASGTKYHAANLREEVLRTLDSIDADNPRLMSQVEPDPTPTVGTDGFTASVADEQSCLDAITEEPGSQALLIDRAHFEGTDAGVVVMLPEPSSTAFEVFVVGMDCPNGKPLRHLEIPVAAP